MSPKISMECQDVAVYWAAGYTIGSSGENLHYKCVTGSITVVQILLCG